MAWVHDTGRSPAYVHAGYPASVLADGAETGTEWSSRDGHAPIQVEGWEAGSGVYAEWGRHLNGVLPELAVYDAAGDLATVQTHLDKAVGAARQAGRSWARIAAAAGISADRVAQRWGPSERFRRRPDSARCARGQWSTR